MPERGSDKTALINWKHLLPVLFPLSLVIFVGVWGVDFGYHWDEAKLIPQIRSTIRTHTFLPGWYRYPSVTYWLNLLGLAPYLLGIALKGEINSSDLQAYLIDTASGDIFHLQVRKIFIVISALAILWVYLLIYVWRNRNWSEALLGALILGTSWEVSYHTRWIAPDGILMQFGALTIFCVVIAVRKDRSRFWLLGAALAAGLGMGTKYPGGLLLAPVLIAAYRLRTTYGWRIILEAPIIFIGGFLLSTPGIILQPQIFFSDVLSEISHYQSGHYGYEVSPFEHLGLMMTYFSQVAFSHYALPAMILFLFSLVGVFALFKESRQDAVLFLSFPVLYVLFFSLQRVMIVRNLLVVLPFLAVLSARGIVFSWTKIRYLLPRAALLLLVFGAVTVNSAWLCEAANSITQRGTENFIRELVAYIHKNPEIMFFASDKIFSEIASLEDPIPSNVSENVTERTDKLVFYASEGMENPTDWPRNQPGLATEIFGPWEVNFDYYPTWAGDDRILVMPVDEARTLGVRALPTE